MLGAIKGHKYMGRQGFILVQSDTLFLYLEEMVYHVMEIFIFGGNDYNARCARDCSLKHSLCVEMILLG